MFMCKVLDLPPPVTMATFPSSRPGIVMVGCCCSCSKSKLFVRRCQIAVFEKLIVRKGTGMGKRGQKGLLEALVC